MESPRHPQEFPKTLEEERTQTRAVAPWAGIRTILVPPDIVAVKRRSPVPVKKRTPWHPRPDGEVMTERAGARDWFSDRLFVETQDTHARAGYGTSITVHSSCAIALVIFLATRPVQTLMVSPRPSLVMPATTALMPVDDTVTLARRSTEPSAPKPSKQPIAAAPAAAASVRPLAPLEEPSSITPETGAESRVDGVEGGVVGGVAGGVVGGDLSGGVGAPGPLRPGGGGITAPRKIKHVKPVYPLGALSDQTRGVVIIEATVGTNGKVTDTKVLQSVPLLDQAAIDAVRQWEYTPTLLNNVPTPVIMTVTVTFNLN